MARGRNGCVWSGMAAGFAAGLAGAFAMALVNRALHQAAGLTAQEKELAPAVMHFAAGGAIGALYGAAAALVPAAAAGAGLPFGAAVWLGGDVYAARRLGLAAPLMDRPLAGEAIGFASYLAYGAATEGLRRALLSAAED